MPVYNYFTLRSGQIIQDRLTLIHAGPLISVEISIPTVLATYNQLNKLPIPTPKTGYALIDTGCMVTSVDSTTVENLGLKPVGVEEIGTAGGKAKRNKYPAHVKFPGTLIEIDYSSILSADLSGQHFKNTPIIALIGRDILSSCIFVYNGLTGMYTFAH